MMNGYAKVYDVLRTYRKLFNSTKKEPESAKYTRPGVFPIFKTLIPKISFIPMDLSIEQNKTE